MHEKEQGLTGLVCPHLEWGRSSLVGEAKHLMEHQTRLQKGVKPFFLLLAPTGALGVGHSGKPGEIVPKCLLGAQSQPGGSSGEKPGFSSTASLLWHCFPSGEGAFWGCDVLSWELKDISFFQLIVHGIDGNCRNEPQGWDGADSFHLHPPQELKTSFRAGETCTPSHISPAACTPCAAPSN